MSVFGILDFYLSLPGILPLLVKYQILMRNYLSSDIEKWSGMVN
jgi:hypothetical protein